MKRTYQPSSKKGLPFFLEGGEQDTALELNITEIVQKNWVDKIIERLNQIYQKDKMTQKYNAFSKALETSTKCINRDFLIEFDKQNHKTKTFGVTMTMLT